MLVKGKVISKEITTNYTNFTNVFLCFICLK